MFQRTLIHIYVEWEREGERERIELVILYFFLHSVSLFAFRLYTMHILKTSSSTFASASSLVDFFFSKIPSLSCPSHSVKPDGFSSQFCSHFSIRRSFLWIFSGSFMLLLLLFWFSFFSLLLLQMYYEYMYDTPNEWMVENIHAYICMYILPKN